MHRGCTQYCQSIRLDTSLKVSKVSVPTGQSQIPHGDKNELSIVLAAAWQILELKFIKYCSSSMAVDTLEEPFPLLSVRTVLSCSCIFCCTLKKHLLKPAAWLQMTVASLADFSHLLSVSCEIRLEVRWVEVRPDSLKILLYELLSLHVSVYQVETAEGSALWSDASPYHLDCDFAGLKNWSIIKPPASELQEGYPSTRVTFNLLSFLQSHSSVGICTETFPGVKVLGPQKGLSSDPVVALSMSGMLDQPI